MGENDTREVERNGASKALTAIRAIVFLLIAAALFIYLNSAFVIKGTSQNRGNMDAFYELPKNSVDCVYIGTSASSRYFIPPQAYKDHGMASYVFGVASCPSYYIKHLMNEALRTQDPQLFVIELRAMRKDPVTIKEGYVRWTLDTMNLLSPERIPMAWEAAQYCEEGQSEFADYLFPIFKYHNRLLKKDMTPEDFLLKSDKNKTMGFYLSSKTLTVMPLKEPVYDETTKELEDESYVVLDELLDYCDSTGKEVLFVLSPSKSPYESRQELNTVEQYVRDRGYNVLDFFDNQLCDEVLELDWSRDFYNIYHTNYVGAEKYTTYLAQYLADHYDLPDHRGEAQYDNLWKRAWDVYADFTSQGLIHKAKKKSGTVDD